MKTIIAYILLCTSVSAQVFNIASGSRSYGGFPSEYTIPDGKTAVVDYVISEASTSSSCYLELFSNGGSVRLYRVAGLQRISVEGGTTIKAFGVGSNSVVFAQIAIKEPSVETGFLPSNTVVIPTDATGSVEIILESSVDLVTWTAALPGTYGSSDNRRFFRVRAVSN